MRRCVAHGEHAGEICLECYALQQERVERESAPLRYANTAPALRDRIATALLSSNGNGHGRVVPEIIEGATRG